MNNLYSNSGNWTVIAGLVVAAFNHFFPSLNLTVDQVIAVISGALIIGGVIKQHFDHKDLAIAAQASGTPGVYVKPL